MNWPILLFLFTSCGSHFVITPAGYRSDIEYSENIIQAEIEEELERKSLKELDQEKSFKKRQKAWNVLGHLITGRKKAANALFVENENRRAIKDFNITTTYSFADVILNMIPIASVRTIIYSGNYRNQLLKNTAVEELQEADEQKLEELDLDL